MKSFSTPCRKFIAIWLTALILALTGCAGAHMGMSYGVTLSGPGGTTVQPHFNVGVYGGGKVW
ncbi:MAG TPA: hypothetical protein VMC08_03800 [Bacteroidales bacterium]|nr:hypothetical protein [Bacteroidales bacterium]